MNNAQKFKNQANVVVMGIDMYFLTETLPVLQALDWQVPVIPRPA